MPASTKSPQPPRTHEWDTFHTEGPAKLYQHMAWEAVNEEFPDLSKIITDDEAYDMVIAAIGLALTTVCIAADIAPNWEEMYRQVRLRTPRVVAT